MILSGRLIFGNTYLTMSHSPEAPHWLVIAVWERPIILRGSQSPMCCWGSVLLIQIPTFLFPWWPCRSQPDVGWCLFLPSSNLVHLCLNPLQATQTHRFGLSGCPCPSPPSLDLSLQDAFSGPSSPGQGHSGIILGPHCIVPSGPL